MNWFIIRIKNNWFHIWKIFVLTADADASGGPLEAPSMWFPWENKNKQIINNIDSISCFVNNCQLWVLQMLYFV